MFSCTNKKIKKVLDYLRSNLNSKFKKPEDIVSNDDVQEEPKVQEKPKEQVQSSLSDELIKLKSLLDQGVISQSEFEQAKAKLLSN